MKYIIDEKELKWLLKARWAKQLVEPLETTDENFISYFLKSKQPVELIYNNKFHYGEFIGDSEKKKYADLDNELSLRNGKSIKIYVREE